MTLPCASTVSSSSYMAQPQVEAMLIGSIDSWPKSALAMRSVPVGAAPDVDGAVVGAVTGAVVGAVTGAAVGATAGAAVGATAGAVVGATGVAAGPQAARIDR